MVVTKDHLIGFAAGVGATTLAYYIYKKNESKVDSFLKEHNIAIKNSNSSSYEALSVEELMFEKERLEDLIAEKEMALQMESVKPVTEQANTEVIETKELLTEGI